jgi:hypothetical protein
MRSRKRRTGQQERTQFTFEKKAGAHQQWVVGAQAADALPADQPAEVEAVDPEVDVMDVVYPEGVGEDLAEMPEIAIPEDKPAGSKGKVK